MSDRPLVIYHSPCLDGFTAAWAMWRKYPDAEFVPGVYGEQPPDVTDREVYLLDFSYKRGVMLHIMNMAKRVVVIDHHKSAKEELVGIELIESKADVYVYFDMEHSGAYLAWRYFRDNCYDEHVPLFVQLVEDRDLWKFALPNSRALNALFFSHPYDFSKWTELAEAVDSPAEYSLLVLEGEAIERKHQKDVVELLDKTKFKAVIGGYEVWCANLPYTLASDAAGLLAQDGTFGATFYIDNNKNLIYSLRSRNDFDVAVIAQQYGGGGHKNAAGFRMSCVGF